LSETTIHKLQSANPRFVNITLATTKTVRGETVSIPESKEVNKDEKKNICD